MIVILHFFFYLFFISAVISFVWVFAVVGDLSWRGLTEDIQGNLFSYKYMNYILPVLIFSFIGIMTTSGIITKLVRKEIRNNLIQTEKFVIKVNDSIISNDSLVVALKEIKNREFGRRISGNQKLKIEINGMNFTLVRDFHNKDLYLVYYDNYKSTSDNDIGIIYTSSLDSRS